MKKVFFVLLLSIFFIFPNSAHAENYGKLLPFCSPENASYISPVWNYDLSGKSCEVYLQIGNETKKIGSSCSNLTPTNIKVDRCQKYELFLVILTTGDIDSPATTRSNPITLDSKIIPNCIIGDHTTNSCEGKDYGVQNDIKSVFGRIQPPAFVGKIGDGNLGVSTFLTWLIRLIYIFAGIAFLFMIIFGAFQILTSGGDKEAVGGGRKKITYAIIGIVVLALSYLIVGVLGQLIGFRFFVGQPT